MKTALKVGPWVLAAGLAIAMWLTAPHLAQSISAPTVNAADTQTTEVEMETRGSWICKTQTCAFENLSNGKAFRSAAPQACPFCGQDLVKEQ